MINKIYVITFSFVTLLLLIFIIKQNNIFTFSLTAQKKNCHNPQKFEDHTNSKTARILVCNNAIYYDDIVVVDKNQYPEIFETSMAAPEHEIFVYELDKEIHVAIFPVVNYITWYSRGGYVFKQNSQDFVEIFSKDADSLIGRWVGVRFLENGSVFSPETIAVNQDLGTMGALGNRIYWSDYYSWDNDQKKYILANKDNSFKFKELMKTYDKQDLELCGNENPELNEFRISELYNTRKNQEHFCFDESVVPFITNENAKVFLKAKKAIELILEGENLSIDDVKNIEI